MLLRGKTLKAIAYGALMAMVVTSLGGCGDKKLQPAPDLWEPASAGAVYSQVARRDVYELRTYESMVIPEFTELSFDMSGIFGGYQVSLGDEVKAGDVLASLKEDSETYQDLLLQLEEMRSLNDYNNRRSQIDIEIGQLLFEDTSRLELLYAQALEIQALDENYLQSLIRAEKEKLVKCDIVAPCDGTVAVASELIWGDYVAAEKPIMVIAGGEDLYLTCEYISAKPMAEYDRTYALIEGKEYELTYIPYEEGVIGNLSEQNQDFYSRFVIEGADGELMGKYAQIMLVKNLEKDVLTVPAEAVFEEAGSSYVYLMNGEAKEQVWVEIGTKGTMYYQVVEGLKEGDIVALNLSGVGSGTRTLTKGDLIYTGSVSSSIYFPVSDEIRYYTEFGTAEFDSYLVEYGDYVEAGDPIALIKGRVDPIDITERRLQLQRMQEDYDDLNAEYVSALVSANAYLEEMKKYNAPGLIRIAELQLEGTSLYYDRALATKKKEINKLSTLIINMQECGDRTEIVAPVSGIVGSLIRYASGDVLYDEDYLGIINQSEGLMFTLQDNANLFQYGMKIELATKGGVRYPAKVVSSNSPVLSKEMTFNTVYIMPDEEMSDATIGRLDAIYTSFCYKDMIVLSENEYFTDEVGTYVLEVTEYGNVRHYFTPGRKLNGQIVAIDGLQEGMVIATQ